MHCKKHVSCGWWRKWTISAVQYEMERMAVDISGYLLTRPLGRWPQPRGVALSISPTKSSWGNSGTPFFAELVLTFGQVFPGEKGTEFGVPPLIHDGGSFPTECDGHLPEGGRGHAYSNLLVTIYVKGLEDKPCSGETSEWVSRGCEEILPSLVSLRQERSRT